MIPACKPVSGSCGRGLPGAERRRPLEVLDRLDQGHAVVDKVGGQNHAGHRFGVVPASKAKVLVQ